MLKNYVKSKWSNAYEFNMIHAKVDPNVALISGHIKAAKVYFVAYPPELEWKDSNINYYRIMNDKTDNKNTWIHKIRKWETKAQKIELFYYNYIENTQKLPITTSDTVRYHTIKLLTNALPTASRPTFLKLQKVCPYCNTDIARIEHHYGGQNDFKECDTTKNFMIQISSVGYSTFLLNATFTAFILCRQKFDLETKKNDWLVP